MAQNSPNTLFAYLREKYHKAVSRLEKGLRTGRFSNYSNQKQQQVWNRISRYARQLGISIQPNLISACIAAGLCIATPASAQINLVPQFNSSNPFENLAIPNNAKIVFVDIDDDGDKDAFLAGGVNSIKYYKNLGTPSAASFSLQTGPTADPLNSFQFGFLAKPAFVDIDNDGDKDLFVGDGVYSYTNHNNISYYKNTGSASSPVFAAQTGANNPLNGLNILGADPTFVDIDNDGDQDMFSGSTGGDISYYKNVGTSASPNFTPITGVSNPLDFLAGAMGESSLAFVDIDSDGDQDAFISGQVYYNPSGQYGYGYSYNYLHYYKNQGTASAPNFVLQTTGNNQSPLYPSFSPCDGATPSFVDIDNDGDQDLFVGGKYDYHIYYCENIPPCISPSISTAAASNSPICAGTSLSLSVIAAGTPPFSYAWTGAGSFTNATTANPTVSNAATGNYGVTITNACGTITSNASVVVNATPSAPVSLGNKCGFTANNPSITLGVTGTNVKWYNNNLHSGTALSNATTYNATTSGNYYAFEVAGSCYSSATTVNATLRSSLPTAIPTTAGMYLATDKVVSGGWNHYCDCPNNKILLSLQTGWNPGNLVADTVTTAGQYAIRTDVGATTIADLTNAPYNTISLNANWKVLARTWDVILNNSAQEPKAMLGTNASVNVRSYFTQSDFLAMQTEIGASLTAADKLTLYKLDSVTAPTGNLYANSMTALQAGHAGITQKRIKLYNNKSNYTSHWTYLANNIATDIHAAEMNVNEFSGGGGGGGTNGNPPFPVELSAFNGYNDNLSNRLLWITESELNADKFVVERSLNGAEYAEIGTIAAVGNSNKPQTYTFNDKTFKQNLNFYRLKMLDKDGSFAYSNVIEISTHKLSIHIYPNPAKEEIFISGNFPTNAKVSLVNMLGQEMLHTNLDKESQTRLSLSEVKQGIYMLNILNENGSVIYSEKLVRE